MTSPLGRGGAKRRVGFGPQFAVFDIRVRRVLDSCMRSRWLVSWIVGLLLLPGPLWAVEVAPALTDREIVERLTRLEEGLNGVGAQIDLLRADIAQLREDMSQLREDMNAQNRQLREDMNLQFTYQFQLTLGLLGAFTVLVAATISFALWDRRTMLRPVEERVKALEADLAANPPRVLLEALRNLSQRDPELASVLKNLNL